MPFSVPTTGVGREGTERGTRDGQSEEGRDGARKVGGGDGWRTSISMRGSDDGSAQRSDGGEAGRAKGRVAFLRAVLAASPRSRMVVIGVSTSRQARLTLL